MCGIFGYIGTEKAAAFLLEGLRTLEYRGYDSAGIFVHGHGVIKEAGPISSLEAKLPKDIQGTAGIAHTRWATHGAPSEKNAHPHHDMSGRIWLVHNGIIENYRELKEGLAVQGITFYCAIFRNGRNWVGMGSCWNPTFCKPVKMDFFDISKILKLHTFKRLKF